MPDTQVRQLTCPHCGWQWVTNLQPPKLPLQCPECGYRVRAHKPQWILEPEPKE